MKKTRYLDHIDLRVSDLRSDREYLSSHRVFARITVAR